MATRPTVANLAAIPYWQLVLETLPERSRPVVDSLHLQAMTYVWGRQDAGDGERDTGVSQEFADAYGRHAAAHALELIGFRRNIQDAYDVWRSGSDINALR